VVCKRRLQVRPSNPLALRTAALTVVSLRTSTSFGAELQWCTDIFVLCGYLGGIVDAHQRRM